MTGDKSIDTDGDFLRRVRAASAAVLGDSRVGREVAELCDEHSEARRGVLSDRSDGATVVAVIGAAGQGKSWLVRQMVGKSPAASSIRSGNHLDEATEKLIWVGPRSPIDLDPRHERFLHCDSAEMIPIGAPYLLVDTPGSSDDRRSIASVAKRALSLASVLVMVVRRDQIRSQVVSALADASEGSLVVPVINAVRQRNDALKTDVDAFVAQMRRVAPESVFSAPILIDDFLTSGSQEGQVSDDATDQLARRMREEVGGAWEGDRRRSTRLSILETRFRAALHSMLSDHLPGLTDAVRRLNHEAEKLPAEVAELLVGGGGPLRAAVRSRLRLGFLTDTAALWFPYRSILSLLNLTHGAWDRLLLSLSGSLPSLVSTVWTSAKNLSHERGVAAEIRDGLRQRSAAAVADRLSPLAVRFRDQLHRINDQRVPPRDTGRESAPAYLSGIDALQEESQRLFDEAIDKVAVPRFTVVLMGIVGTAIFWTLMSGPIVALYRGYFDASVSVLSLGASRLDDFPHPTASMLLTSLLLSLLPTAIFAMLVLSWAQRRSRIERAENQIRQTHHQMIQRLQQSGVLRLCWDDPLLADAEFLLTAGHSGDSGDGESGPGDSRTSSSNVPTASTISVSGTVSAASVAGMEQESAQ
ncbi:MAG: hypothetical protein AAGA03_04705 [Planctomycetota bacterium]